jgi:hypothetical protein
MTETHVETIPAEYLEEEAEATETEIAERMATLDVPLNLRISRALFAALRRRAGREQIPVSALVRRLLTEGLEQPATVNLAVFEELARRIAREEVAAAEHKER